MESLLSVEQAAQRLNLGRSTLYRMVENRLIGHVRTGRNRRTIRLRGHEPDRFHLRARDLCGMDALSPTLSLLAKLAQAGYGVEGCKLEVLAMRHHLESLDDLSDALHRLADNRRSAAISITF